MTPRRHAELVYKRAGKGCRQAALRVLRKLVHDQLRREIEARRMGRAA